MGLDGINGNPGKNYNYIDYIQECIGCNSVLPGLGNVLMNCPPPWIVSYFQQQWFPEASNELLTSDQFQYRYAPTGTGGGGGYGTVKPDPNDELTDEEKVQAEVQRKAQEREKNEAIENYSNTRNIISNYVTELKENIKTLPNGENKTNMQALIDTLEGSLDVYKEIKSSTKLTKEKILEKQGNLQKLINDNKDKIKTFSVKNHKKAAYFFYLQT